MDSTFCMLVLDVQSTWTDYRKMAAFMFRIPDQSLIPYGLCNSGADFFYLVARAYSSILFDFVKEQILWRIGDFSAAPKVEWSRGITYSSI